MEVKNFCYGGFTYSVSNDGRIFGKNDVELKQRLNSDGYPVVTLGNEKIKRTAVSIHRIVCENFVENKENKPEVNHIDGNKQNNHYTNLEWNTRSENMLHAFRLGLKIGSKGSKNGRAILSEPDVKEIRKLYKNGFKISELRDKFGVGWTTISHVLKNETWN